MKRRQFIKAAGGVAAMAAAGAVPAVAAPAGFAAQPPAVHVDVSELEGQLARAIIDWRRSDYAHPAIEREFAWTVNNAIKRAWLAMPHAHVVLDPIDFPTAYAHFNLDPETGLRAFTPRFFVDVDDMRGCNVAPDWMPPVIVGPLGLPPDDHKFIFKVSAPLTIYVPDAGTSGGKLGRCLSRGLVAMHALADRLGPGAHAQVPQALIKREAYMFKAFLHFGVAWAAV